MSQHDLTRQVKEFVTPVTTVLWEEETIGNAMKLIRERHVKEKFVYFYAVDKDNHLTGVISTRTLLLSDPHHTISDVMEKSVVHLQGSQTLRDAMSQLERYHLLALPVVGEQGELLGVIDVDLYLEEASDIANSRLQSDIFQMIGMYMEEGRDFSYLKHYWNRMPWIFCNLFGGIACAIISRVYEDVLAKVLLLAMFIPLILTLSESISMQSLTQSMQLLRTKRVVWSRVFHRLFRDWKVVVMIAITCGLIVGVLSLLWGDGLQPAIVIMLGIIISVSITAFIGAVVPLILHSRRWDPKVAAGPVVLMFADVLTTAIYLSIATVWLL